VEVDIADRLHITACGGCEGNGAGCRPGPAACRHPVGLGEAAAGDDRIEPGGKHSSRMTGQKCWGGEDGGDTAPCLALLPAAGAWLLVVAARPGPEDSEGRFQLQPWLRKKPRVWLTGNDMDTLRTPVRPAGRLGRA